MMRQIKILLPDDQSNDIEDCFISLMIYSIKLSNLPGFNRLFLPVHMGDFCRKHLSKTCKKFCSDLPLAKDMNDWCVSL